MDLKSLDDILKRSRTMRVVREQDGLTAIRERWEQALPADVARQARILRYKDGKLTVQVESPPLLQELSTYRKAEIVETLRRHEEFRGLVDIVFRSA